MATNNNTDNTGRNMGHGHDQNHDFGFQIAYVTDSAINDPEKKGRYAISNMEQANIPQGQQTWIPSMTNDHPQLKGIGSFGDKYLPGSRVVVAWHGPHKFILGAVPNYEQPDDNKADYNNAAQNKHAIIKMPAPDGQKDQNSYLGWASNPLDKQGKMIAISNCNMPKPRPGDQQDACQTNHEKAMTAMKLGAQVGELAQTMLNNVSWSMGPIKFMAGPNAVTNALSALGGGTMNGGNLFKGALQMSQSMQSFAKKGALVDAMSILGGMGNWLGGLASIASLFSSLGSQFNPKQKQKECGSNPQLEAMYEAETGQPACDEKNENYTPEYNAWLQTHINSEPSTITSDMLSDVENPLAPSTTPESIPTS